MSKIDSPTRINYRGVAYACLSTSLGGMTVALTRFIIAETEPLTLTAVRYGIAALILMGIVLAAGRLPKFARADWPAIIALALVFFTSFPYFMARALEDTTATRGGIFFATMPLVTILLAGIFRIERMTWAKAIGVVMALRGDIFMLLGMISAATFNVFSKRYIMAYGALNIIAVTMVIGVSALAVLAIIFESPLGGSLDFDFTGWAVVLTLAIPGAALMIWAWGRALSTISPTQAAVTVGLNPVVAIAIATVLLSEPFSVRVVGGLVLIIAAIAIANRGSGPKPVSG
jgi:drug/metabolite transporter (DMT)-like permease